MRTRIKSWLRNDWFIATVLFGSGHLACAANGDADCRVGAEKCKCGAEDACEPGLSCASGICVADEGIAADDSSGGRRSSAPDDGSGNADVGEGVGGIAPGRGDSTPPNGGESGSGDPSGEGGESGSGAPSGGGGESGSGAPSGEGGQSASGAPSGEGGEGGGPVACTSIALSPFESDPANGHAIYTASFTPNILGLGADTLELLVLGSPYNGDATGTFDLSQGGDENFATCSRCFVVTADHEGSSTVFFQSEGTLAIDEASTPLTGAIKATITNLRLIEVTIDADLNSTPVPAGACLTVTSATIDAQCVGSMCLPAGWQCSEEYVGDGECDCGCGAKDTDCTNTTSEDECEYCPLCSGNLTACPDNAVDPQDTTSCL